MRNSKLLLLLPIAALASACAPAVYKVADPAPSGLAVAGAEKVASGTLAVHDVRPVDRKVFSSGTLTAGLQDQAGAAVDPVVYLSENLQAELESRGFGLAVQPGGESMPRIDLRAFHMINHRSNGYAPFVTFTFLSADAHIGDSKRRIGAWVKRGKVPVWSFDEIIEPTLNQPLSIAIKELGAKLAIHSFGAETNAGVVDGLLSKVSGDSGLDYLDVYALGFTGSPRAIDRLTELTSADDEYVRIAAISSLGIIGDVRSFDTLKAIHQGTGLWQDRGMALKSIGDLGTEEALAYLQSVLDEIGQDTQDKDAQWSAQIIALYL